MVIQADQKLRRTKTAVLIVGEGPTEKAFLHYLRQIYVTREMDIILKVECGSGGSPRCVVEKAVRLKGSRAYDKCFVLVDTDRPFEFDKKLKSRMIMRPKIEVLKATPCIEGLMLVILKYPNFSQQGKTSDKCKSIFEKEYLSADKKTDKYSYEKIFSKQILEERRKNILELEAILKTMEQETDC